MKDIHSRTWGSMRTLTSRNLHTWFGTSVGDTTRPILPILEVDLSLGRTLDRDGQTTSAGLTRVDVEMTYNTVANKNGSSTERCTHFFLNTLKCSNSCSNNKIRVRATHRNIDITTGKWIKKIYSRLFEKKIYSRLFERKTKNFQGRCEPRISVLFKSINIVSIFITQS